MKMEELSAKDYLLAILKAVPVIIALLFSFYLWVMGAIARLLGENHRLVTGTDPIGAKKVIEFGAGVITSFTDKGRELIARYLRKFHPKVWRKLKDHLRPRR